MNRRAFLGVLGGVVCIGGSSPVSADGNETDWGDPDCAEEETVVVGRSEGENITRDVSAVWEEHVEHVEGVNEEVSREYADEPWFVTAGVTGTNDTICGHTEMAVRVRANDTNAAREVIGEERDGVRILVDEARGPAVDMDTANGNASGRRTADTAEEDGEDEQPGFSVSGAIVSIGGIAYALARRRSDA